MWPSQRRGCRTCGGHGGNTWAFFWSTSPLLYKEGEASLCITSGIGVMSSWDAGNSEMKAHGELRQGVSLEPTKKGVIRILRAQP